MLIDYTTTTECLAKIVDEITSNWSKKTFSKKLILRFGFHNMFIFDVIKYSETLPSIILNPSKNKNNAELKKQRTTCLKRSI